MAAVTKDKVEFVIPNPYTEEDPKYKDFEAMWKQIRNSNRSTTALYGYASKGQARWHENTACHAGMTNASMRSGVRGFAMATYDKNLQKEEYQSLAHFLYKDKKSPYYPVIEKLGKDFHVVEEHDGIVRGFILTTDDIPMKALMALAKSTRTFSEHDHIIPFWKKWHHDKGVPASGLLFMMSYFYTVDGGKRNPSHSPVENQVHSKLNLAQLLGKPSGKDWGFVKGQFAPNNSGYAGENEYMWGGGKFDIKKHIRKAGVKRGVPTTFYKKYFERTPEQLSDEDIMIFIKDAFTGKYDEYL